MKGWSYLCWQRHLTSRDIIVSELCHNSVPTMLVVGFFCQITEWTFVGQVTDRLELANIWFNWWENGDTMYRIKFLKAVFNDKQEMVCPDAGACLLSVCLEVPFVS